VDDASDLGPTARGLHFAGPITALDASVSDACRRYVTSNENRVEMMNATAWKILLQGRDRRETAIRLQAPAARLVLRNCAMGPDMA
jgi:hypothetical protein